MKQALVGIITFLLSSSIAFAGNAPEVFTLKVKADLEKVVPDPSHPGLVNETPAPGGGKTTTNQVVLDQCQVYGGANHCSGVWTKTLTIDGVKIGYWVGVFNNDKSNDHAITLTICLSGEDKLEDCNHTVASEIDFKGTSVPDVNLYTNKYNKNPFYQPTLEVGDDLK